MNADILIAAVWRAVAKAMTEKAFNWDIERARAVLAAEHVEKMLRLTEQLYQSKPDNERAA